MGLFDYTIQCFVGDYKQSVKLAEKLFNDDIPQDHITVGDEPRGCCMFNSECTPIIWIPGKPTTPREYATLAHESTHAVLHMFRWAALPVSDDTEEVLTHSIGHVIDSILRGLEND